MGEVSGKTSVLAKDTPAFIGNRIGVFGIQSILHEVDKGNYSIEEIEVDWTCNR